MKAYHVTEQSNANLIRQKNCFFKYPGMFGVGVYFYNEPEKAQKRGEQVNNHFQKSALQVIEVELSADGYVQLNSIDEYVKFCTDNGCSPGNKTTWKSEDLLNKGIKGIIFNTEMLDEIVVYDLSTIKIQGLY